MRSDRRGATGEEWPAQVPYSNTQMCVAAQVCFSNARTAPPPLFTNVCGGSSVLLERTYCAPPLFTNVCGGSSAPLSSRTVKIPTASQR